jgi:predicted nuclease of predicted toxin-antitoxin system
VKFIVDAQLPKSLSDLLKSEGFDSIHTLELPRQNKTKDTEITQLAIKENRIVISKDVDFLQSFIVRWEPRKLIMVRTGNIPNSQLLSIFQGNLNTIIKFIKRSDLVEVGKNDIAEHG